MGGDVSCLALCLTCKAAGLKSCPFGDPAPLPLVEAEKPKVTYASNQFRIPKGTDMEWKITHLPWKLKKGLPR